MDFEAWTAALENLLEGDFSDEGFLLNVSTKALNLGFESSRTEEHAALAASFTRPLPMQSALEFGLSSAPGMTVGLILDHSLRLPFKQSG